ncbi:MAG: molybdopterin-guanine dinucleotide biosynthesis protein B [Planctomycetes bacterium]|nr:molybdopterin-guanine dinucleotide biosynthesis protein B [Planctomycetota bacterium]
MLENLPIFGVCGFSGSGKTTLIEQLVRRFHARGLHVAVAKHDAHGIDVDRPGKDSDRFYQAGGDVLLSGPGQEVLRTHRRDRERIIPQLMDLAGRCDVVLVEGRKHTPLPKLWLLGEGETSPPTEVTNVLATLPRDTDRLAPAGQMLEELIERKCKATPVFGAVLIGGNNSRMDRPRHLLVTEGRTWLRRTVDVLAPLCSRVVILGDGEMPGDLPVDIARLPGAPGVEGRMGGALAAMRWAPYASWLMVACDLLNLTTEAVRWLLAMRTPGRWAVLPKPEGPDECEPVLAHCDFRCRIPLEHLAFGGAPGLSEIGKHPKTALVPMPAAIRG